MARKSRFIKAGEEAKTGTSASKSGAFLTFAGIYMRLSIEDEDKEERNSIGNQKKLALDYLKDKENMIAAEFYADNGYTGMNFNRPGFQRMLKDIYSGRINCVIVKDISRLGRHFVMTGEFVEKIFPMMGVRLICINDDYDSFDENCDSAALLMPFRMMMNDLYVKDISKKIRSSISAKMDNGTYLPSAGSIPYGYIRNPEKNTFDIDEEAAPVVVRIYEMRAAGTAINTIARLLNAEEIPCPGRLRYIRGTTDAKKYEHALWVPGTLRKILTDQAYIGNRVHGKVKGDKLGMDKTRRFKEEWRIIEDAHRPIISRTLYERVQEVMNMAALRCRNHKEQAAPQKDFRDILRGKVYCGDCKSRMRGCKGMGRKDKDGRRSAYIYYECSRFIESGRAVCASHYIRQDTVMEAIEDTITDSMKNAAAPQRRAVVNGGTPGTFCIDEMSAELLIKRIDVYRDRHIEIELDHERQAAKEIKDAGQ